MAPLILALSHEFSRAGLESHDVSRAGLEPLNFFSRAVGCRRSSRGPRRPPPSPASSASSRTWVQNIPCRISPIGSSLGCRIFAGDSTLMAVGGPGDRGCNASQQLGTGGTPPQGPCRGCPCRLGEARALSLAGWVPPGPGRRRKPWAATGAAGRRRRRVVHGPRAQQVCQREGSC